MIKKTNVQDLLPLSLAQEAILYEYIKDTQSETNFEQLALILEGTLNIERCQQAWNATASAHDMLRTCFRWSNLKKPVQIILKEQTVDFQVLPIAKTSANSEQVIKELLKENRREKFNLEQVPFRIRLYRLESNRHLMILSNHHILFDGWSMSILLKHFLQQYAEPDENLLKPVHSFKDFLQLQLKAKTVSKYWEEYLGAYGGDFLRVWQPKINTGIPKLQSIKWPLTAEMDAIHKYVKQNKITVATLFNTCWGMLLQHINGGDDIIFDTVRSVRPTEGFDTVVGLFIQTYPVRLRNAQEDTVLSLFQRLQEAVIAQLDKGNVPPSVIRACGNDNLLFNSLLIVENYPLDLMDLKDKLSFDIKELHYQEVTKYDLTLVVLLMEGQTELSFTYNEEIMAELTVKRLGEAFLQLIIQVTQTASLKVAQINWELIFTKGIPENYLMMETHETQGTWITTKNGTNEIRGFSNLQALSDHLRLKTTLSIYLQELKEHFIACSWLQFVVVKPVEKLQLILLYHATENFDVNRLWSVLPIELKEHIYDIVAIDEIPNLQILINMLLQREKDKTLLLAGTAAEVAEIIATVLHLPLQLLVSGSNLFELGADSFGIVTLRNTINEKFQVNIPVDKIFTANTIHEIAMLIDSTKADIAPPLSAFQGEKLLISQQQSSMIMHEKISGNINLYHQTVTYKIIGEVDTNQMEAAFRKLIARHEILRTTYHIAAATIQLTVLDEDLFSLKNSRETFASSWFAMQINTADSDTYLQIRAHHALADGVSLQRLANELLDLYCGIDLQPVVSNYQHYCYWQETFSQTPAYAAQRDYYLKQILTKETLLRQFSNVTSIRPSHWLQEEVSFELPLEFATSIKEHCRQYGFTRFQWYTGVFAILMSRYLQQEKVFFNLPANGRSHAIFEETIGLFINTVIAGIAVNPQRTVSSQLEFTKAGLVQLLSNQDYPYAALLQDLKVNGPTEFEEVHNIYLNYLISDVNHIHSIEREELSFNTVVQQEKESVYKLSCYFYEGAENMSIKLQYNTSLFAKGDITYLLDEYIYLLRQCLENPDKELDSLDVFSSRRVKSTIVHPAVLHQGPFSAEAVYQPIHRRFEQIVLERGEQVALENLSGHTLTYSELNAASNHLGRQLLSFGLQIGDRVILLFDQDELEQFVAIIGCLKAGAIYVPLDPEMPYARILQIIADVDPALILTTRQTASKFVAIKQSQILYVDDNEFSNSEPDLNQPDDEHSPAYILYTSGSTGTPKGVVQAHSHVVHFARAYVNGLGITPTDTMLLLAKCNFDAAKMDLYGALLNGSTLLVLNVKKYFITMADAMRKHKISIFHATPTLYREFLTQLEQTISPLPSIRAVILGGEAVYKEDFSQFKKYFEPKAIFVNGLGPTESTITLQYYLKQQDEIQLLSIPVGLPTIDTSVYLLDENEQEVPVWSTGEIVYKSPFLALGYWNNEVETKNKFKTDPITGNGRVYRSGDLGKRLPDGTIIYIGRADTQLKLHGYRVEPGEIEATLDGFPEIQKSVVVLHTLADKTPLLVAHCRFTTPVAEQALKERLKNLLPGYMIPDRLVEVNFFPLTSTGKIDRKLMTVPDRLVLPAAGILPVSLTEKTIAAIWADILQVPVDQIGTDHNFFDLGGNSVKLLALSHRLSITYNRPVSANEIFTYSTVVLQAKYFIEPEKSLTKLNEDRSILENKVEDGRRRLRKRLSKNK